MERFAIKIDKNLKTHLYKICRLCGIDNPDKVKVLDDETIVSLEDGEPELWKKVVDCIGLLITKDDKMPQFMCTLCVDKINDFFEFREMCYATDGQTRKLLGIKEEPKQKIPTRSSVDCKTEDQDIKLSVQTVASTHRSGRKRRNADLDICNSSLEIKSDLVDDVKPATATASTNASKKKRLKLDNTEAELKPDLDVKPGPSSKVGPTSKLRSLGAASKFATSSKLGLPKKRLKIEPIAKEKKEIKPSKMSKLTKKKLKGESAPPSTSQQPPEERKPAHLLQMQKKKKTLELLKQQKLAKKAVVVKVDKLRKGSSDSKIKEEIPVPITAPAPTQPKVKLKDKCTICSEGFVNKTLMDKHIKVTHIPAVVRYYCVQCNETLKKNMEIKNHNLWHKLSKTPFQCGNCSESSCSIYTYSKHIRDCSQVGYLDAHIPDWHCPECSEVFQTTYLFNIHTCVANKLVCPGCDRKLKWKEDYLKHIPSCAPAVHRIPEYMSSNIQVKNEAEQPASPVPPHHTLPPITPLQPTPPLMDSNQCVIIPGNVALLEEPASPTSKSTGKKSKRITKKDLKRFDKLLKSTMTTLVSIKQEPAQGEDTSSADKEDAEQPDLPDASAANESPPGSPSPADDDFQHNDTDDDSTDEQTSSSQPVGTIKQEIIDEGYRDLYNNIEVNIKREVVLVEKKNTDEVTTPKKKSNDEAEDAIAPKPVLKLKITKEHGTLNSVLLDSPKSEKKKKKKKRKEEKLKAAENREESHAVQVESHISEVPVVLKVADILDIADHSENAEEEPPMPLPEIICIKQEIIEPDEQDIGEQISSFGVPSIVAATSGSLQIACVAEGVQFNGAEENYIPEETDQITEHELPTTIVEEQQEELDIKPRLEDLIPMLRIASVSSGEDLVKKSIKAPVKRKRRTTFTKPSTSTPKIVSVASGNAAFAYQPEAEKPAEHVEEEEDPCEEVDSNENMFDYTQVTIKEELVDPTYEEQDSALPEDEVEEVENDDEQMELPITNRQVDEDAYIANIDFDNLNIKQEKEYIDDGLDNGAASEEDDSSDTESESSTETEGNDSESEREYRDLPLEEIDLNTMAAPLGLQIAAVHSEFVCPQNEKTEANQDAHMSSENRKISNSPTETITHESDRIALDKDQSKDFPDALISTSLENCEEYSKTEMKVYGEPESVLRETSNHPLTLAASVDGTKVIDDKQTPVVAFDLPTGNIEIQPIARSPDETGDLSSTVSNIILNSPSNDARGTLGGDLEVKLPPNDSSVPTFASDGGLEPPVANVALTVAADVEALYSMISMETENPSEAIQPLTATAAEDPNASCTTMGMNDNAEPTLVSLAKTSMEAVLDDISFRKCDSDRQIQLVDVEVNIASPSYINNTTEATKVTSAADIRVGMPDKYPTEVNSFNDITEFIEQTSIAQATDLASMIDQVTPSTLAQYNDVTIGEEDPVVSEIERLLDDDTSTFMNEIDDFTGTEPEPSKITTLEECGNTDQVGLCLPSPMQSAISLNLPSASVLSKPEDHQLCSFGGVNQINELSTSEVPPRQSLAECFDTATIAQDLSIPSISHAEHSDKLLLVPSSVILFKQNDPNEIATSHPSNSTQVNLFTPVNAELASSCVNSEFLVDLSTPTGGQLQPLIAPINVHPSSSSNMLPSNADLGVPILSEEVQNLLNEDTVAANNFELNDSILRARCSSYPQSPAVAVLVPNFTDFENVNEIAENNNNANIERELQDELGNVIAAAIAGRSSNDEVDDNNVMNENRANFDIT